MPLLPSLSRATRSQFLPSQMPSSVTTEAFFPSVSRMASASGKELAICTLDNTSKTAAGALVTLVASEFGGCSLGAVFVMLTKHGDTAGKQIGDGLCNRRDVGDADSLQVITQHGLDGLFPATGNHQFLCNTLVVLHSGAGEPFLYAIITGPDSCIL